ncbi:MAG: transcription elongation factor GreA [Bdellovibrionota bacterium]|nr:transcription elongation factor GreA [Pseudobdellovibrionaceae bacterium]|tara:strand:+ start:19090 stop:19566 length:477 start_codon:yes stop_codon:yes gene_type:complete
MAETFPLTLAGKEKLEVELKRLVTEERPAVVKAIEEARSHGDLSENADYDAAKDRQGYIEARISEIQGQLANAQVINVSEIQAENVVFGATVKVVDIDTDKEMQYQIVGVPEADVDKGKISVASPIARALIGKYIGDQADVKAPGGVKSYEIVEIQYI